MRFASLFVVAVTAVAAVSATFLPFKLFKGNHWGAPIPPWQIGCRPGWYFGDHFDGIEGHGIPWLKDQVGVSSFVSSLQMTDALHHSSIANSSVCLAGITSAARDPTTRHLTHLPHRTVVETMGTTTRFSAGSTVRFRQTTI
ncbi:hypothetical protein PM082_018309 [Marasmius tenuissimus]|nr:hypothetical protein PM082_018309 [Marasmius tenuissimus]